jgi:hypothetical protein
MHLGGPLAALIPGVFFQFVARCLFVHLYHKVERVIQVSLEKQDMIQQQQSENQTDSNPTDASVRGVNNERNHTTANNNLNENKLNWTEAAKLRLQLNDASCGVAAGVGFGGMHAILLYGTLLASEATNNAGVLYQSSCPAMPALVVSGLYACLFTILDVFWMLMTFFGMRRRMMYHRGDHDDTVITLGSYLGNSRNGGNLALLLCLVTHFAAAFVTLSNYFNYGCIVSIPLVGTIVLITAYVFWAGMGRIYMPVPRTSARQRLTPVGVVASSSFHED